MSRGLSFHPLPDISSGNVCPPPSRGREIAFTSPPTRETVPVSPFPRRETGLLSPAPWRETVRFSPSPSRGAGGGEGGRLLGLLLFFTLCLMSAGPAAADVTPTARDNYAAGKNRVLVAHARAPLADRLDVSFLLGTLAKKGEVLEPPARSAHLYQEVDPVPLASYKVYTPWLDYFQQNVVFVIGQLDPKRFKIARWSVALHDPGGRLVRTFSGLGQPPEAFFWNGRDAEYNPVPVGQSLIPEITLIDYYGARVNLPQKNLLLEQFVWEDKNRLEAGFLQSAVFRPKSAEVTPAGRLVLQELSNLLNQNDAVLVEVRCSGSDADLTADRTRALREYFARENLRAKKVQATSAASQGEPVVNVKAFK
jgi:hypothetical protein